MQLPFVGKVKNPVLVITGLVAVGAIGLATIGMVAQRRIAAQQDLANLTVAVTRKDLTVQITANGTVLAVRTVNLSPKTAGRVSALLVEQGDRVAQGDLIAQMENADLEAQRAQIMAVIAQAQARLDQLRNGTRSEELAQAESAIQQAQAQVEQARSRLQLATERSTRNRSLYTQGAIARDRLDEVLNEERNAMAALEQAKARVSELDNRLQQLHNGARPEEIAQAEAQVAEAEARLQAINTQIEESYVRAPFSGIITQKYAVEGAFVTPTTAASATSSATSTSIVALASGLEVLANVPEVDIGRIKLGQQVEIRTDAYPDQVFRGKVRLIAPAAVEQQNVTSFQVRISLITGNQELKTGMNTDLVFLGDVLKNVLTVPTVSIVTQDGQTGVYMPATGRKAKFVPVTIGPSIGTETQILEGLNQGDLVFVDLPKDKRPREERR